jgi:hypothetical protein
MLERTVFFVSQKLNLRLLFVRIKNKFLPHGKHASPSQPNRACHGVFIRLQAFLINFIGYRMVGCGILTGRLHKLAIKRGIKRAANKQYMIKYVRLHFRWHNFKNYMQDV